MEIDQIIESLDNKDHKLTIRHVSFELVQYLRPWTTLETEAHEAATENASDFVKNNILELLWKDFGRLDEVHQARRRIFVGILCQNSVLDGYSGAMLISFAIKAGIDQGIVSRIFWV